MRGYDGEGEVIINLSLSRDRPIENEAPEAHPTTPTTTTQDHETFAKVLVLENVCGGIVVCVYMQEVGGAIA